MKKVILLVFLFAQISLLFAQEYKFYAISDDANAAEPIFLCKINGVTGIISVVEKYSGTVNGNYFAISPDSKHLLVTSKNASKNEAGLVQFDINEEGKLTFVKNLFKPVTDMPCHVSFTPDQKYVLSANYGNDEISLYSFSNSELTSEIDHIVKPDNSKGHFICTDPTGKYVHAVFLGLDKVFNYTIENNKFAANTTQEYFSLTDGYGPRHLVFHPDNWVYILNETHSSVTACSYNSETGEITKMQNISMLPEGFTGTTNAAAIRLHPNGKFLYASNRGHNSIVVYEINNNGQLALVEHETTGINFPRDFIISSDGKFMVVGNQKGGAFNSYWIDETTGELSYTGSRILMSKPTAFAFLPTTASETSTAKERLDNSTIISSNLIDNVLHIHSIDGTMIKKVELYDISGKLVKRSNKLRCNTLDVSELAKGIYLLVVTTPTHTITEKIIRP